MQTFLVFSQDSAHPCDSDETVIMEPASMKPSLMKPSLMKPSSESDETFINDTFINKTFINETFIMKAQGSGASDFMSTQKHWKTLGKLMF